LFYDKLAQLWITSELSEQCFAVFADVVGNNAIITAQGRQHGLTNPSNMVSWAKIRDGDALPYKYNRSHFGKNKTLFLLSYIMPCADFFDLLPLWFLFR